MPEEPSQPDAADIEALKQKTGWFVAFQTTRGDWRTADKTTFEADLHSHIAGGVVRSESSIDTYAKGDDGGWTKTSARVGEFVKRHFKLGVMYEPVWTHAMSGLTWGAIIGAGLKVLHTIFLFFAADRPEIALGIIGAFLLCLPRIPGWVKGLMLLACIQGVKQAGFGFITGSLMANASALFTGAAVGCLPGMAIGGIVGFARKDSIPHPPDARPERNGLFLKTVVFPGVGAIAVWILWLCVLTPWIEKMMN